MKKLTIILLFLLFPLVGFSQMYSGKVHDESGKPMQNVNVGVVGKDIGCVTDRDGGYEIEVGAGFENETIRFSYIGYDAFAMKLSEFDDISKDVTLYYLPIDIEGVVVKPMRFKDVILGKRYKKNSMVSAGFDGVDKGYEMAGFMKIKKKTFIKTVVIQIAMNTCDTVVTRLNIYQKDGEDWEIINLQPIYVKINPKTIGDITIDLEERGIDDVVVDDDVLVALEWLGEKDGGEFFLRAAFPGRAFSRKVSQGSWEKQPISIAISVDAQQQRR